jgi:hypothetical protein
MAKNETSLSATTLDVFEIAPHASPSNKLGINQSNGSNLFGMNASIVASDHQRSRRKSIHIKLECSRSLRQNLEHEVDKT